MANGQRGFNINSNDLTFMLQQIEFRPLFKMEGGQLVPVTTGFDGTYAIYDATGAVLWNPAATYSQTAFASVVQHALAPYGQLYTDTHGATPVINWATLSHTAKLYDAHGNLIWNGLTNSEASAAAVHITAAQAVELFGLSYSIATTGSSATDISGLRNVSGFANNLVDGQQNWGADGSNFARVLPYDPKHYVQQQAGGTPTTTTFADVTLSDTVVSANTLVAETPIVFTNSVPVGPGATGTSTTTLNVSVGSQLNTENKVTLSSTLTDGHHTAVNSSADKTTTTVTTTSQALTTVDTTIVVKDAASAVLSTTSTHSETASPEMVISSLSSSISLTSLSGGELDPLYHGQLRAFDPTQPQVYVPNLVRVGNDPLAAVDLTAPANSDYSITFDPITNAKIEHSIVDYTPRMISQTTTQGGSPVHYQKTLDNTAITFDPLLAAGPANTQGYAYNYKDGDGLVLLHDGANHVVYWDATRFDAKLVKFVETALTSGTLRDAANNVVTVTTLRTMPANTVLHDINAVVLNPGTVSWNADHYTYSKPIVDNHVDTTDLVEGSAVVNTGIALLPGQADGTGGLTAAGDLNLYSGAGYGTYSITGQHDKQNTDANNVTGHGNHEYFYGNIASIGGNAPNNGWFALFGQFFDHGLDFIGKDSTYQVVIPLAVDDPLYGVIGADGNPTTSITINRAIVNGQDANGVPTYTNHDSPYIDQSQTYGSAQGTDDILREWVKDPNTGNWIMGARLFDGTTSVSYTDAFGNATTHTLPTLNELRNEIGTHGTARTDLSWEDVSQGLRFRDANGVVITGTGAGSGEPLILDMNPRFDHSHLNPTAAVGSDPELIAADALVTTKVNAAVTALSAAVPATYTFGWDGAGHNTIVLTHGAATYSGLSALIAAGWVNPADFSITLPAGPAHDAVGQILLATIGDHYVAGDGRANENIGLTAIHHVFHEEHDYQVENIESFILKNDANSGDATHANAHDYQVAVGVTATPASSDAWSIVGTGVSAHYEAKAGTLLARDANGDFHVVAGSVTPLFLTNHNWSLVTTPTTDSNGNASTTNVSAAGSYVDSTGMISWDQNKIFDAAKMTVEMEYQHVAVDQYARAVSPNVQEFAGYSSGKNADISMEYGQAAFRFGHSTLRDTIDAMDPTGGITGKIMSYALEKSFLNPQQFAQLGAGSIALGMERQLMNEVDNYITPSLNEGLLGQPLDLAAINIARGRDVGLPTFNAAKTALGMSNYADWASFRTQMVHPESIANFIAAYNFDGDMLKAQTIVDLNDGVALSADEQAYAATLGADATAQAAYANHFMNGGDADANGVKGIDKVDLWIGGIAELHVAGGVLGETFDTIFVNQIEKLMDGDRFYYLQRLINQQFGDEIQNQQFKDIVERTTGVTNTNGNIFTYADKYYDESKAAKFATEFQNGTTSVLDATKAGDLYDDAARTHKVFDGATKLWLDSTGHFTQTYAAATTTPAATLSNPHPVPLVDPHAVLTDLWGQHVTDLFDAAHNKVFSRATMTGTLTAGGIYYVDANANADGTASATPNYVFVGADSHDYGQIVNLAANANATNLLGATGVNSHGDRVLYDQSSGHNGVGIWSVNDTTTNHNGSISHHIFSLPLNDGTALDGLTPTTIGAGVDPAVDVSGSITIGQDYIFDARPNGTSTNNDGSLDTGADSAEVLVGTKFNDYIDMGIGDDTAYGGAGNDVIFGGKGNAGHNTLYGGDGQDFLYGGDAPDLIDGGNGDDWVWGMSSGSSVNGVDQLIGGAGNDHIFGGIGIDKMFGGQGDDYMYGGTDTDPFMFGGDGNDYLNGNSGQDILFGGNGSDIVDGGTGIDQLFGDSGDDILRPGDGVSDISGNGGGGDVLIGGDGVTDTGYDLADYSQQSSSNLTGLHGDLANQVAIGALPKDVTPNPLAVGVIPVIATSTIWSGLEGVVGTRVGDVIMGDSSGDIDAAVSNGNNWLIGGSGSDLIEGRGGNDVIVGGSIKLSDLIGHYVSAGHSSAYHAMSDYSVDANGASHRVYDNATLSGGILAAASTGGRNGVTFDAHFQELLKSSAYQNFMLGDGGSDAGSVNTAAYSDVQSHYTFTIVHDTSVGGSGLYALKVHGASGNATADGTDLLIGVQQLEFSYDEATNTGIKVNVADIVNAMAGVDAAPLVGPTVTYAAHQAGTNEFLENTAFAQDGANNGFNAANTPVATLTATDALTATQVAFGVAQAGLTWSVVNTDPLTKGLFTMANVTNQLGSAGSGGGANSSVLSTAQLVFATAPDFEAIKAHLPDYPDATIDATGHKITFNVQVQASDGALGSITKTVAVVIDDVTEKTTGSIDASIYVPMGALRGNNSALTLSAVNTLNTPDTGIYAVSWQKNVGGTWTNVAGTQVNKNGIVANSGGPALANLVLANAGSNASAGLYRAYETFSNGLAVQAFASAMTFLLGGNGTGNTGTGGRTLDATVNHEIILGMGGNDTITVKNTNVFSGDILDGGAGTDTVNYTGMSQGLAIYLGANVSDPGGIVSGAGTATNLVGGHDIGTQYLVSVENVVGTAFADTITGDDGNNVITGGAGNDTLDGAGGSNTAVFSGSLSNHTVAWAGNGHLTVGNGTDGTDNLTNFSFLRFGNTTYALQVDTTGSDIFTWVNPGAGVNGTVFVGGTGANTYNLGAATDAQVHIFDAGGIDTITSTITRSLANYTSIENLTLLGAGNINGTGNALDNVITGNSGNNILTGGGHSAAGHDALIGGAGADTFVFVSTTTMGNTTVTRDVVVDFAHGIDRIDLSAIDANTSTNGNQPFIFDATAVGTTDATGVHLRGHVGFHYENIGGTDHTIVEGNTNSAVSSHNFQIDLIGNILLDTGDFVL